MPDDLSALQGRIQQQVREADKARPLQEMKGAMQAGAPHNTRNRLSSRKRRTNQALKARCAWRRCMTHHSGKALASWRAKSP